MYHQFEIGDRVRLKTDMQVGKIACMFANLCVVNFGNSDMRFALTQDLAPVHQSRPKVTILHGMEPDLIITEEAISAAA